MLVIKNAQYKTSVVSKDKIIQDGIEFAFVGRSNVGKSSFINALVNQKNLCNTSSTPGRTRMINYFEINNCFRFVDLPGYGFAKAGGNNQDLWSNLLEFYLLNSKPLKRVFMLIDIRIDPTIQDKQMLNFLSYYQIPFSVIATKADKLPKSKIEMYIQNCAKILEIGKDNIIAISSENKYNLNKVYNIIENDINKQNI